MLGQRYRQLWRPKPTIKDINQTRAPAESQWMPGLAGYGCDACGRCAEVCPTGAITFLSDKTVEFARDACIACRACIDICPSHSLVALPSVYGATSRTELKRTFDVTDPSSNIGPEMHTPASKTDGTIKIFAKSLHAREVDCGSCNACELEIAATGNPVYDVERFGIHIVASPRHADALFVTGPVTRQLELALEKTNAATPSPKLIVAIGTCACSGGLFGGTSMAAKGIDAFVNADLYIPGCPPSPLTILKSIFALKDRVLSRG